METAPSCPCHPDIERAIAAHQNVVTAQAEHLGCRPGRDGWDDLISDGMVGLWKALAAYDPSRGTLDQFLSLRVRFRMIDGLRTRLSRDSRRPLTSSIESLNENLRRHFDEQSGSGDLDPTYGGPARYLATEDDLDSAVNVSELIARSGEVDPRLPRILGLLSVGYTQAEAGEVVSLSRTRVWQLVQLAKQSA